MKCLTTPKASKALLVVAEAQIAANIGCQNAAGTTHWDTVKDAVNDDISYIFKPDSGGFQNPGCPHFTQEQMLDGVSMAGITEMDFNTAWRPEE